MNTERSLYRVWAGFVLAAAFAMPMAGQSFAPRLQSVQASGGWTIGGALQDDAKRVEGPGAAAAVRVDVAAGWFLQVGLGYGKLSVDQPDAITKWNWPYWNIQYRNNIIVWLGGQSDSVRMDGTLVGLKTITNEQLTSGKRIASRSQPYAVTLTPYQYVNVLPVDLSLGGEYVVAPGFRIGVLATLTFLSFDRNLYLEEVWEKNLHPDVGGDSTGSYIFSYSFKNYATSRKGFAWGAGMACEMTIGLTPSSDIGVSAGYRRILESWRPVDAAALPLRSMLNGAVALKIRY